MLWIKSQSQEPVPLETNNYYCYVQLATHPMNNLGFLRRCCGKDWFFFRVFWHWLPVPLHKWNGWMAWRKRHQQTVYIPNLAFSQSVQSVQLMLQTCGLDMKWINKPCSNIHEIHKHTHRLLSLFSERSSANCGKWKLFGRCARFPTTAYEQLRTNTLHHDTRRCLGLITRLIPDLFLLKTKVQDITFNCGRDLRKVTPESVCCLRSCEESRKRRTFVNLFTIVTILSQFSASVWPISLSCSPSQTLHSMRQRLPTGNECNAKSTSFSWKERRHDTRVCLIFRSQSPAHWKLCWRVCELIRVDSYWLQTRLPWCWSPLVFENCLAELFLTKTGHHFVCVYGWNWASTMKPCVRELKDGRSHVGPWVVFRARGIYWCNGVKICCSHFSLSRRNVRPFESPKVRDSLAMIVWLFIFLKNSSTNVWGWSNNIEPNTSKVVALRQVDQEFHSGSELFGQSNFYKNFFWFLRSHWFCRMNQVACCGKQEKVNA